MGAIKIFCGKEVEVVSVSGGWTTIIDSDGKNRKVRNGELKTAPVAEKPTKIAAANAAKSVQTRKADKKAVVKKQSDGDSAATQGVVLKPDLSRYEVGLAKTVSGRRTVDINDNVAASMRGASIQEAYEIASKILNQPVPDLLGEYKHLNLGMQRMNLGNRCRAALLNREKARTAKNGK